MRTMLAMRTVVGFLALGSCVAACAGEPRAGGTPDVDSKGEALAAEPEPPLTPEERASRAVIARALEDQTPEAKRAYHRANAQALREELRIKRAALRGAEDARARTPANQDRVRLDDELTSMRASITRAEQRLAESELGGR